MRPSCRYCRSAFSLIEVLIAIMILGIGLLMVAAVFPVAGNWTRQSAEEGMGQSVARSAFALIQQRYEHNQLGGDAIANTPDAGLQNLVVLPGLGDVPPVIAEGERAYELGVASTDPARCTYFWTALAHKSANAAGEGRAINLVILVFHRGSADQTFTGVADELPGARPPGATWAPTLCALPLPQASAVRPGEYALGEQSGTVYRRIIGSAGQPAFQPPLDPADSNLLIAPPADGTAASPLVYVYQTTLSF